MITRYATLLLLLATTSQAVAGTVTQTNLVSDGKIPAAVTDPNLKNPWGVSYGPGGAFWVSDNATGLTTLYSGTGAIQGLVVTIPAAGGSTATGSPTGQIYNGSADFVVKSGKNSGPASFVFCTEDGTISGWNFGVDQGAAIVAVDRSAVGAVYKGLALYTDSSKHNYLLATDFRNGTVDVFNGTFTRIASFSDTTLPAGYAPYNVAVLGGNIFVTYAMQDPAKHDSVSGHGRGAVEEVTFTGQVLARAIHGALNAPWGLALAPSSFGKFSGDLLVGNFGSGEVLVFSTALAPRGAFTTAPKKPLFINGLWDIIPGNGGMGGATDTLYFTAGPNREADGLLGALNYKP